MLRAGITAESKEERKDGEDLASDRTETGRVSQVCDEDAPPALATARRDRDARRAK